MALVVLAVVGLGWLLASKSGNSTASASSKQLLGDSPHLLGTSNSNPKVQIVEFGDFQCPACGAMAPILKQITDKYKNNPDFSFAFRNFPLPQHANAIPAAVIAEAAGRQNKYWEMFDMLYSNQNQWAEQPNAAAIFSSYAQKLGLDQNRFKQDAQTKEIADKINSDLTDGQSLGINATPTIYVNGVKLNTLPTFKDLDQQISDLLK